MQLFTCVLAAACSANAFVHPGALYTAKDIERVKQRVNAGQEPWKSAWTLLTQNGRASNTRVPAPVETIVRGTSSSSTEPQNYSRAFNDAASAYQLALRWKISGDKSFADAAIRNLNAWSSTLKAISNVSVDQYLAAGLYGYQWANAGELLRDYSGWAAADKTRFSNMLVNIFAAKSIEFLEKHNGNPDIYHYYANWDQCNLANLLAVGIFTDNQTMYNYALKYVKTGPSNGALPVYGIANFTEAGSNKILTQGQEAGRDQGHAMLGITLAGIIAQQAYNQGDDLFATYSNQILNMAEYAAKYNVNQTVPFKAYTNFEGTKTVISPQGRSEIRPGFELIVAHYQDIKGRNASWSAAFRDYVNKNTKLGVEGGGGDYSPNSGGFDALGYGTLMYRLK